MESVTIQCNICFNEVVITKPQENDFMYIVPLLTLTACNHHYCVSCIKQLQKTTALNRPNNIRANENSQIYCPTCRKYNSNLRVMCINDNNVFAIKFCAANIEHYSTSSVNLKLVEYINTYYDTSVMSNSIIGEEHGTIVTVTELSKLQTELAQLNEAHRNALDLSEELDNNIYVLKNNLVSLNNQVQNKQDTRDALDQIIVAKRKELDKLKWEITQSDVKLASIKRNYQEMNNKVKTRTDLNENLTKQNTFLRFANNKLRTENEELYNNNKELHINVKNVMQSNTIKLQKKIGEYFTKNNDEVIDITDDTPDEMPNKKIKLYL